jgi:DNA-binding transcriptional regulator LsrR (DeoR family)
MPLATEPLEQRQERWDEVQFLRHKKGWDFEDIGQKFGISRARAERIFKSPKPICQYGGRPRKNGPKQA